MYTSEERSTFRQNEISLRENLQYVSLVSELEITPSSSEYVLALKAVNDFIDREGIADLQYSSFSFPASLAVVLTTHGVHNYEAGTFWQGVEIEGINSNTTSIVGKAFLKSLDRLGLQTFDKARQHEGGLRFVMPILLHGQFPKYCCNDFWELLERSIGQTEATTWALRSYWERSPSAFEIGIDKPLIRFIKYGGDLADNLIERAIDFLRNEGTEDKNDLGRRFRLSSELISAFYEKEREIRPVIRTSSAQPEVRITPYGGRGPVAYLPPIYKQGHSVWSVEGNTYEVSSLSSKEIALDPKHRWDIAFTGEDGIRRSFTKLGGHSEANLFFFEPFSPYKLVSDHDRLSLDSVYALSTENMEFTDESTSEASSILELEDIPELVGDWKDWKLKKLNLSGITKLGFEDLDPFGGITGSSEKRFVYVSPERVKPRLQTTPIPYMTEEKNGWPVLNQPPKILLNCSSEEREVWSFRLSCRNALDEVLTESLGTLNDLIWDEENGTFDFQNQIQTTQIQYITLEIRGRLGSDLKLNMVLIPDLEYQVSSDLVSVNESASATVSARNTVLNGNIHETVITFSAGKTSERLEVGEKGHQIFLIASIPRIRWAIQQTDKKQEFGIQQGAINVHDISQKAVSVEVLLGTKEEINFRLIDYETREEIRRSSEYPVSTDDEGRYSYSLIHFVDDARGYGKRRLQVELLTSKGLTQVLLDIYCEYEISNLAVENLVNSIEARTPSLSLRWDEQYRFQSRVLRIWSRYRSWQQPFTQIIENDFDPNLEPLTTNPDLPVGGYYFEIGIDDGWVVPKFPAVGKAKFHEIGTKEKIQKYLDQLDETVPLNALEIWSAGREISLPCNNFFAENFHHYASVIIRETQLSHILTGQRLEKIVAGEFEDPSPFISWFTDESIPMSERRKLLFVALPEIMACNRNLDSSEISSLWATCGVAAAFLDSDFINNQDSKVRFINFTGFGNIDVEALSQQMNIESLTSWHQKNIFEPPERVLVLKHKDDLLHIRSLFHSSAEKKLNVSGYIAVALDLLADRAESPENFENDFQQWRMNSSVFSTRLELEDFIQTQGDVTQSVLKSLRSDDNQLERVLGENWPAIFQELLANAIWLIQGRRDAAKAIMDADKLTSSSHNLVDWALLTALIMRLED